MNILDEKLAEFQKLSTEEKIECFERNGMWTRAALIAYIFDVHEEILKY